VDKRNFLKFLSVGAVASIVGRYFLPTADKAPTTTRLATAIPDLQASLAVTPIDMIEQPGHLKSPAPDAGKLLRLFQSNAVPVPESVREIVEQGSEKVLAAYLAKMQDFESIHQEDIYLKESQYPLLINCFKRLDRVQNLVGYGNFNVLSFDDMRKFSARYSSIGQFLPEELTFLEEVFADEVSRYGFLGEKVVTDLTNVIPVKGRVKISSTGHFLFRGEAEKLYKKVKADLGSQIVLPSGIRSIVKQTHLFLGKTIRSRGNLSKASRSLAPPGHSFHGIGDFDVGKVGFGLKNFTSDFARTDEYKRLVDLGYVAMRYPEGNLLGVRYEPWHIRVT